MRSSSRRGHLVRRIRGSGANPDNDDLNRAGTVLAFAVSDTGIGIAQDKHKIIFEAFNRPTAARAAYGGTGLGLAISRELARLLGGEIRLTTSGKGSTFTLYLPQTYTPPRPMQLQSSPPNRGPRGEGGRALCRAGKSSARR